MFIGASPGSTGGGIRTTTLAVIIVTIFSKLMGRKDVIFMKRRIDNDIVLQSFMIFFISLFLIILGTVVLYSAVPDKTKYTFSEYVIECTSAFGTVGLSCGITSEVK
jgi:Trk-type K+ transport system membrane component